MSATRAAATRVHLGEAEHRNGIERWGMLCFIATEAALFAYLFFAYFFIHTGPARWPPPGPPDLALVGVNTAILLSSSATAAWATRGLERGDPARLRLGLAVTFVLGAVFLTLQLVEYSLLTFSPRTGAYGSLFFTITGFHGAHVLVGLLMLAWVQLRAWLGHFDARHRIAVDNAATYWHFVDAVWIIVFTALYVLPHL